jgi:hypothetical protein
MSDLRRFGRSVLILAAAIIVAVIALKVLAVIGAIIFNLVTLLLLAAVVWVVFLVARSAWGHRESARH